MPGPEIRALGTVQQLADDLAGQAKAPRSVRAYATDWRDFIAWTTSATVAGASERAIMAQTGHCSLSMVRRYIREGELFRDIAAALLL